MENHPDIKHLISKGISAFMDCNSETLILHFGNLHSCINPVTLVILTNLSFSAQVGKKHFYRSYKIKAQ
jgi:hypothetical protein